MSYANETDSDDEFKDALGSTTNEKSSGQTVEELIAKHENLKLLDEDEDDIIPKEQAEVDVANAECSNDQAEFIDDIIDEEALKELEKNMTQEELIENKEKALQLKLEGNELFKAEKVDESIAVYTDALKICPTTHPNDRAVLYGNRAAAKIKLDSKKSAIEDCSKAIELWPQYVRAILRRAKLYELEEKYDEALEDYKRVYELDPGQHEAREAMVRLPPLIQARNERMKDEMISKLKDLGNTILKPFGLSTQNFQMQQDPNTGSYSINFNQNSDKR